MVYTFIEFIDDKDTCEKYSQARVFFINTIIVVIIKIGGK